MEWASFFGATGVALVVFFLPGALLLGSCGVGLSCALCYAPLISVALCNILAVVYHVVGIPSSFVSLMTPLVTLFAFLCLFRLYRQRQLEPGLDRNAESANGFMQGLRDNRIILLFCLIGIVLATRYFVLPLDGPSSFVQDSDNSFHLALIKSFADSSDYSSLHAGLYLDAGDCLHLVDTNAGFYPAAWHCICAMIVDALGVSVPLAANAVNYALLAFVFPCAVFVLLASIYRDDNRSVAVGAFFMLAFTAYPWGALYPSSGPLYPNFIGLCMLPAFCSLVIDAIDRANRLSNLTAWILAFFCGLVACALAHPNVLFASLVVLVPFSAQRLYAFVNNRAGCKRAFAYTILFFVIICACWAVALLLPFMQGVVWFEWDPYTDVIGACISVVSLALRTVEFPQWILGVLVILGLLRLSMKSKCRWLVASWIIAGVLFIISAATDGDLENILTGFWYTDPYRVAFLVALVGIAVVPSGIALLVDAAGSLLAKLGVRNTKTFISILTGCFVISLLPAVYCSQNKAWGDDLTTAFGNLEYCLDVANNSARDNTFDAAEREFVKRVAAYVDPSAVIYNCADDGSPFSYAIDGLNLAYRRSAAELLETESIASGILRVHLNEYATNKLVQRIVKDAHIKYVLVLDYGGQELSERCYYGYYWREKWLGINNLTDDTPGFRVVLSEGDMRLYEIE